MLRHNKRTFILFRKSNIIQSNNFIRLKNSNTSSRYAKYWRAPIAAFVRVQLSQYINPTWRLRWPWPRWYVLAGRTESETLKWSHFRGNRSVSQSATYRVRARRWMQRRRRPVATCCGCTDGGRCKDVVNVRNNAKQGTGSAVSNFSAAFAGVYGAAAMTFLLFAPREHLHLAAALRRAGMARRLPLSSRRDAIKDA